MNKVSKIKKIFYNPIFFGIVAGIVAVLAQPIFKIQPPSAYGLCTVCHGRDLINWFSVKIFKFEMESAVVSINYPLLTTVGLIVGALISSKLNKEFKVLHVESLIKMFFLGLVVSIFGLIIMSCPTRLFLRFAYSDPFALIAIFGLIIGIGVGSIIIKRF